MDTFEEYNVQQQTSPRAASPFADSPYVAVAPQQDPYIPAPPKKKKEKRAGIRGWVAILLACVLAVACSGITAAAVNLHWQRENRILSQVVDNKLAAMQEKMEQALANVGGSGTAAPVEGLTPAQVYYQNVKAVVAVTSDVASGSGFIVSEDGYIVTNHHVIEDASVLQIIMSDGTEFAAQVIGYESSNDVALLKVEATDLPCVKLGSSDALVVGDQVAAVGNPLGELTSTLTVGYVSAKDRIVSTDGTAMNMLQTDAAINSGNSGGPLFNMKGEVVGITTAKYSGSSNSGATIEGIGFAIPIDDVIGIISDLKQYGYVTGAYLGVMVRDVEAAVIQGYGFPSGAYVDSVTPGDAADVAGIRAKDIIVNLGGYEVTSVSELTRVLRRFKAGDTTTVTVFRSGAEVNLSITLGEKPQNTQTQQPADDTLESDMNTDDNDWLDDFFWPFFGQG